MEIRGVGNAVPLLRPAVEGETNPSLAQGGATQLQVPVQTTRAVTQVSEPPETMAARKPVDSKETEALPMTPEMRRARAEENRAAENRVVAERAQEEAEAAAAEPKDELAQTRDAVDNISDALRFMARGLQFSVDRDLGRVVVKIVDAETQEVVKQIPSEEAIALAKSLGKMTGMLVKTQA
ncbi:MAG: flagellar protein FlaG [Burkholderiaceae bacterium]|jgi:flagellar protein FlaG|nr:flagellar protein FlaG [Burkholderiaceae bacterium]